MRRQKIRLSRPRGPSKQRSITLGKRTMGSVYFRGGQYVGHILGNDDVLIARTLSDMRAEIDSKLVA